MGSEMCIRDRLKYATSGDITGDYGSVVGYASVKIELKG